MSKPMIKVDHAIVCDDIRTEDSGKQILIGVYTSNILVQKFPVHLVLSFWIEGTAAHVGDVDVELRIIDSDNNVLSGASGKISIEKASDSISVALKGVPVQVMKDGHITLQIKESGKRWKKVKQIEVKQR